MSAALLTLGVAGAGGAGATSRYLLDGVVQDRTSGRFPAGTLVVNLVGSFVLGLVTGLVVHHGLPGEWRRVVGVGFCGGLTTFSSATFEVVALLGQRARSTALAYSGATAIGSLLAAALGLGLAHL
jgi:fluoride exporter